MAGKPEYGLLIDYEACVKHCMANVIQWGRLEDLAGELGRKPRMVLWSPR